MSAEHSAVLVQETVDCQSEKISFFAKLHRRTVDRAVAFHALGA
jgi:hypothetical protein